MEQKNKFSQRGSPLGSREKRRLKPDTLEIHIDHNAGRSAEDYTKQIKESMPGISVSVRNSVICILFFQKDVEFIENILEGQKKSSASVIKGANDKQWILITREAIKAVYLNGKSLL